MQDFIDGIPVKAQGVKILDDEDGSVRRWVLIDKDQAPADDAELVARIGFVRRYQGPGMPFTTVGHVRRVGKRVLVTQFCGRDI